MQLIDTHCHLAHKKIYPQIDDILARATQADVAAIICASGELGETQLAVELAGRYPNVYAIAGVHPHEAAEVPEDYLEQLEKFASAERCLAVGEIGLDYHYDFSPRPAQQEVFAAQLALAAKLDCPVVIHTREAFDDTLAILAESDIDGQRVLFHSFTGGAEQGRRALNIGASLSFSGIATFKNADDIRQTAELTPADRIMIETDAPYLSPEPMRKIKTNEPAFVAHVATRLAEVRGLSVEQLASITTANSCRFFGIEL